LDFEVGTGEELEVWNYANGKNRGKTFMIILHTFPDSTTYYALKNHIEYARICENG